MTTLKEDLDVIVDMATGADGGVTFIHVRKFIESCDREGKDVPFVRQTAQLCRIMKEQGPER